MRNTDFGYNDDKEEYLDALDREDEGPNVLELDPSILTQTTTLSRSSPMKYRKYVKDDHSRAIFKEFVFIAEVRVADKQLVIDCNYNYGDKKDYPDYMLSLLRQGLKTMTHKLATVPLFEQIIYNFIRFAKADPVPTGGVKGVGTKTQAFFPKDKVQVLINNFCDYLQQVDPKMSNDLKDECTNRRGRDKILALYRKLTTELPVDEKRLVATLSAIKLQYGEITNEKAIRRKFSLGEIAFDVASNSREFSKIIVAGPVLKTSTPLIAPASLIAPINKDAISVQDPKLFLISSQLNGDTGSHVAISLSIDAKEAAQTYILRAYAEQLNIVLGSVTVTEVTKGESSIIHWGKI